MCDFKPGDEVVRIKPDAPGTVTRCGQAYIVEDVVLTLTGLPSLILAGVENGRPVGSPGWWGHAPQNFRKVQKRNDRLTIEAFSVIKDGGFEEPKRSAPAKKRERV